MRPLESFLKRLFIVDECSGGPVQRKFDVEGVPPLIQSQDDDVITRYDYNQGPAFFIGQVVVKRMGEAGWPSRIYYCYRDDQLQAELYAKGRTVDGDRVTNAPPFESAHQYFGACDVVHKTLYWHAPPEYWEMLAKVIKQVSREFKIELDHGHFWNRVDSAHFEIVGWRAFKKLVGKRKPTQSELDDWFALMLRKQWTQYKRSKAFEARRV